MCSSMVSAAQYAPDKLDDFTDTINSKLQPMFMQIRKGMSEDSGQQYYALVSQFLFLFWLSARINFCGTASTKGFIDFQVDNYMSVE